MNYFTKSLCNKAAKLNFINLDYIEKYLAVLRDVKHSKEDSALNKVMYSNLSLAIKYYFIFKNKDYCKLH